MLTCPHCGALVNTADAPPGEVLQCPTCQSEFSVPDSDAVSDALPDALDSLRIRQVAALKRATYRSRSHALIAAAGCAVAVAQLVMMTIREVLAVGWSLRPMLYALLGAAAVVGAIHFVNRALAYHAQAARRASTDPTTHPDFSTLSDGSQQVKNLEDMQ